jgi:hypothetical protein
MIQVQKPASAEVNHGSAPQANDSSWQAEAFHHIRPERMPRLLASNASAGYECLVAEFHC